MKQPVKFLLSAFAAMLVGVCAFAQVTTSSLNGHVKDASGVSVIGAAVIATHTPSGTQYATVTNSEGRFFLNGMRAGGPYTVEISCLGYKNVSYEGVTLSLAEDYNINAVMSDDSELLESALVVSSANSKFSNEKTGAATNISNKEIEAMPTISRSITDITRLSPYGGNGMSFAGSDGRLANFTVDGANFNNNFGLSDNLPGGGAPISIDALEEVQVVISPYDVRQNNFIGGGVNAITKSGTNTFKGSAYAYYRGENLRGDAVDREQIAGARDKDRKFVYGFTLGGPIVKNKLFFFVNFEYASIPTIVNRWRASEDGVMDADNKISRTTLADMAMVSKHVKDKYGYDTGSWTDYPANESNMKVLARIDWNINDKNHLALRYNYTLNRGWNSTNASSMDGGTRSAEARLSQYSMAFANSMYSMDNIVHTVSADLNSRFTDNLSNQLLFTFSKLDDIRGTNSSQFPFIDIMDGTGANLPYMALGYELFTWNNGVHNNVINLKDDITYYAGNHKVTAGVAYEYQMADNAYMRNGTGYYRYLSLDDFLNGKTPEVVGLTYGYDGEENPAARVRFHRASLYAQDEWNATERFKLTYGLRLEALAFANKDLMTNQAIYDIDYNGRHIDTGLWPKAKIQVSPRIGFSWDILGDKSLKLRGGTGIFTGRLPLVFFTNMPTNSGMVQYAGAFNATSKINGELIDMTKFDGGVLSTADLKAKLIEMGCPNTITAEDGTVPSKICAVDPSFKMPQVWKTSIALDYSIPVNFPFSLGAEFIYNKSINAVCMSDWSMSDPRGFSRFNGIDNRPIYPTGFRYANKAFVLENTNKGYGWSASATLKMSPVEGLDIAAAYTHVVSKEITGMPGSDAESAFTYVPTVNGPNNIELHNSQYVTPDRYYVSLNYSDRFNNHFGVFYEAWRGGYNYSYMTVNDMNGDGYNYDALYIPTDAQVANNEFRFKSESDRDRFMDFVHGDKYLSKHQGQYAEGYSVYNPWVHRVDLHYAHDFRLTPNRKNSNIIQLCADLKNALNLFASSWGVSRYMNPDLNSGRILKYEGVDAEGYPTFSTPAAVGADTRTWVRNHDIGQCWYAQIGIKYLFN